MQEKNMSATLSPWIPLIGTLLGALFDLGASFFIATFNKNAQELSAKNERNRKRIERIYELLITIRMECGKNSVKFLTGFITEPIPEKEIKEIPPLVELEMLVNLYFPERKEMHKEFLFHMHNFWKMFMESRFLNYKNEPLTKNNLSPRNFSPPLELLS
jgi:hypothetical protein